MAKSWYDRRRENDIYAALTGKGRNSRSNDRPAEYVREERDCDGDDGDGD